MAHQGDALTGCHLEVDVGKDGALRRVAKAHVVQGDRARDLPQLQGALGLRELRGLVDEREDALGAGHGVLQLGHHARDVVEGLGVLVGVGEEGRKAAHRDAAGERHKGAEDAYGRVHQRVGKAHGGVGQRREEHGLEVLVSQGGVHLVEACAHGLGHAECLHAGDSANHLLGEAGELSAQAGLPGKVTAGVGRDELGRPDRERRENGHHQGDGGVQAEHEGQGDHDGEDAGGQLLEAHDQAVGELVHVRHYAAGEVSVLVGVNVGKRHLLDVVEGLAAQVAGRVEGEAVGEGGKAPLTGEDGHDGEGDGAQARRQAGEVDLARPHDAVHRPA